MRHNVDGRKLGRTAAHRRALYRNLVISLIQHERIKTTTPKAKEARRLAERLITFAKRGDLSARRHAARILHDKAAVKKLFDEIGPRYAERAGGYTRVVKFGKPRRGDSAEMALLEFVQDGDRPDRKRSARKAQPYQAPGRPAAAVEEKPAAEEAAEETTAETAPEESSEEETKKD
jgi:large subunit ribosomal protein L17